MSGTAQQRVLVTGASGFVGGALLRELVQRGYATTAASRHDLDLPQGIRQVRVGGLGPATEWRSALEGCSVVVHCAARVHVMRDNAADPLHAFREANVAGSASLARQAHAAGVRRFVFVSSIKVNGESTSPGRPFTAAMAPAPQDPYGVSKSEAEAGLQTIACETGMELVIVRSPLVYGPGVKANFLSMTRWLERGLPLPFGGITGNRRSFVGLDNLIDLLIRCVDHPAARNEIFLAGDGEDLSTAELLRRTANALGVRARLLPIPAALLKLGASMVGRPDLWQRLGGSLQVDISRAAELLGWRPPVTVDEGLARTMRGTRMPAGE